MLLRTLAGSRAGQIEDYDYPAARNALAAGFAERLDVTPAERPATADVSPVLKTTKQAPPSRKRR